jgi:putative peptide zinc metalloprotease protein
VFELDLSLPETGDTGAIGETVYVRFDHGLEPLALRAYRGVRRLLLSHLSV